MNGRKVRGEAAVMGAERKPAYWAVLPAKVRYDTEVPPRAVLLYAEITALADASGYCWASNNYFAQLYGVSTRTIQNLINALTERGYVTVKVLRDPNTNEVTERQIWIDAPPAIGDDTPHEENFTTPPEKKPTTPPEENFTTPHEKNFVENNKSCVINNNTPRKPPKGGGRAPKKAPDWKPERFEAFWGFYRTHGRGENKQGAIRAWDRLRPDDALIDEMARSLSRMVATEDWQRGIGVPYASTWLNNRRWEDEPPVRQPGQGEAPGGWAPDPEVY